MPTTLPTTLSLTLPPLWPIALALLGFGAVGFRRGWLRELATLGGLLLCWLLLALFGLTLVAWANRLGLMAAFTWHGGFDLGDPAPLMRSLRAQPAIDPWRPELFHLVLFPLGGAAAAARGLPVVKRARLVGALTRRTRALCVAGTAGKTTTTAMCAVGLLGAGLDPSALVGASVPGIGVGGR